MWKKEEPWSGNGLRNICTEHVNKYDIIFMRWTGAKTA